MADRGLVFIYGELGPNVSEDEFNDWYDNEHGPALLAVPGFNKAVRYKATDGATPTWLATFDLSTAGVMSSAPFNALVSTPRDIDIISRIQHLDRRVYDLISAVTLPDATTFPNKFAQAVAFRVPPELDAEFNKWYDEEHIPLLAKVPTFLRARRYKLVDSVQLAGPEPAEAMHNYLTLYDTDRVDYTDRPAFKVAVESPWTVKILSTVGAPEARRFGLHNELRLPAYVE